MISSLMTVSSSRSHILLIQYGHHHNKVHFKLLLATWAICTICCYFYSSVVI